MKQLPSIFQFTQFRRYLEEYQIARQQLEADFSKTEVCKRLGLKQSRSYFSDIVRGKILSARMVEKFIEVYNLTEQEAHYFRTLVNFDQAPTPTERATQLEKLLQIHPNPQTVLEPDAYQYYSQWYHSTIFAILDVVDIKDDLSPIAKKIFPPLSTKSIQESVELLQRLGLIRANEQGFLKPTRNAVSSGPYNNDDLILQYQLQCFELSKKALNAAPKEGQNMSTLVFSLSDPAAEKLEKSLQKFKDEIRQIVREDSLPATKVQHLNLHLFTNFTGEQ